jgi:hypothetical protein
MKSILASMVVACEVINLQKGIIKRDTIESLYHQPFNRILGTSLIVHALYFRHNSGFWQIMETAYRYFFLLFIFLPTLSWDLNARGIKNMGEESLSCKQKPDSIPQCIEIECSVFIHVVKSSQTLYLYENGALIDTFSVSTGTKNHPTPDINMRPNGPTFIKYTSKKYPEGNYKGLGNMPYVIFIKGGYAIHGTTPGNFLKLGHRASHGCLRLHPDNAKKVFDLVNLYGLENTWVKVHE